MTKIKVLALLATLLLLILLGTQVLGRRGLDARQSSGSELAYRGVANNDIVPPSIMAIPSGRSTQRDLFAPRDRLKVLLVHRLLSSQTIFVNVAAFRDLLCVESVREIFSAAKHPERISVGVIDQRISGDRVCLPPEYLRYLPPVPSTTTTAPPDRDPEFPSSPKRFISCYKKNFCPSDNIRIRYVDQREARGPTYGRYVAGLMYQGESFYMMIDSHSRFHPHFDEAMILDALRMKPTYEGETGAKGGVLSYYPPGFQRFDLPVDSNADLMAMCKTEYVAGLSVLRNGARWVKQPKRPLLQPYTAAGFVFSDATAQLEVPFDPYLDFVFDGEEILYTVRLYTAGYDAYMPGKAHIYHHYDRHKAHRFWSVPGTNWGRIQEITRNRVHYFLETYQNQTTNLLVDKAAARAKGVDIREEVYGLGKRRTVDQFYKLALVDRKGWRVDQETFCSAMERSVSKMLMEFPVRA